MAFEEELLHRSRFLPQRVVPYSVRQALFIQSHSAQRLSTFGYVTAWADLGRILGAEELRRPYFNLLLLKAAKSASTSRPVSFESNNAISRLFPEPMGNEQLQVIGFQSLTEHACARLETTVPRQSFRVLWSPGAVSVK